MYDIGSEEKNIAAYMRDLPLREKIRSDETLKKIYLPSQNRHIVGTKAYENYRDTFISSGQYGPSILTVSVEKAQELIEKYCGTGNLGRSKNGTWSSIEVITNCPEEVGIAVNNLNGKTAKTTVFTIHYSNKGTHIVPDYPSKKGAKARK